MKVYVFCPLSALKLYKMENTPMTSISCLIFYVFLCKGYYRFYPFTCIQQLHPPIQIGTILKMPVIGISAVLEIYHNKLVLHISDKFLLLKLRTRIIWWDGYYARHLSISRLKHSLFSLDFLPLRVQNVQPDSKTKHNI